MLSPAVALCSCCSNVVLLEILIREIPGCGNVITLFQFLFIAIEGFIFTTKFGTIRPKVPIKSYIVLVLLFFAASVSNNYALNFDISMPLHMIFKSGSLVTNMFLGMLILKKRYALVKYISVFMVTCGIFLTTWASDRIKGEESNNDKTSSTMGILLLSFSLIVSAGLGIYQETLFKTYGKHSKEALFYSHTLPLPGFILLAGNIYSKIPMFSASEPIRVLMFSIPKLWLCLIGNVITQYICIRSVFYISATYSSLTVTMLLTFRKFLSLIFSIVYFQNPFTFYHWFGAILVFTGTVIFTDFKLFKTKVQ